MASCQLSSGEVSSGSEEDVPTKKLRSDSPHMTESTKRRVNDVWKSVIFGDNLEYELKCTSFHSDAVKTIERGPESFSIDLKSIKLCNTSVNTRTRPAKERLAPRTYDKTVSREHYGVSLDSSPADVTGAIARILREPLTSLVDASVKTLGVKRALEFCYIAEDLEKLGGMMTSNGSRRRTPGGVFFFLIQKSGEVSENEKKKIFAQNYELKKARKRKKRRAKRRPAAARKVKQEVGPERLETTVNDDPSDIENIPSPEIYLE